MNQLLEQAGLTVGPATHTPNPSPSLGSYGNLDKAREVCAQFSCSQEQNRKRGESLWPCLVSPHPLTPFPALSSCPASGSR